MTGEGIRYNQDVFKKEDGSSRILSIWDQTIQSGEPPEGFLYGTEYKREEIDRALQSGEPLTIVPSTDENGHGTAMASAAAGSIIDQGLSFRGAAPQADIAVVKLKGAKQYLRDFYLIDDTAEAYQENDIMEAVKYLEGMAIVFQRPVVIVVGIGTNMGDHEGNSPLASYLDQVATRRSRAVVVCGGNEGDKEHHYTAAIPEQVELRVGENTKGFCMELWGNRIDIYSVVLRTPGGEMTSVIDFRNMTDNEYSFLFDRTKVYTGLSLVEKRSGNELVFFRFENPSPGIWSIIVTPSEQDGIRSAGRFHLWLPITAFIDGEARFLEPSPDVTLTEPANARNVITVSAYNGHNGSWFSESGRGFTANSTIKPDLAAPGVQVSTALGKQTGKTVVNRITQNTITKTHTHKTLKAVDFDFRTKKGQAYYASIQSRKSQRLYDYAMSNPPWAFDSRGSRQGQASLTLTRCSRKHSLTQPPVTGRCAACNQKPAGFSLRSDNNTGRSSRLLL